MIGKAVIEPPPRSSLSFAALSNNVGRRRPQDMLHDLVVYVVIMITHGMLPLA